MQTDEQCPQCGNDYDPMHACGCQLKGDARFDHDRAWARKVIMDDNRKSCTATPAKTLEERIMNPGIAKSDAEWWAMREIERLREQVRTQPPTLLDALRLIHDCFLDVESDGTPARHKLEKLDYVLASLPKLSI